MIQCLQLYLIQYRCTVYSVQHNSRQRTTIYLNLAPAKYGVHGLLTIFSISILIEKRIILLCWIIKRNLFSESLIVKYMFFVSCIGTTSAEQLFLVFLAAALVIAIALYLTETVSSSSIEKFQKMMSYPCFIFSND